MACSHLFTKLQSQPFQDQAARNNSNNSFQYRHHSKTQYLWCRILLELLGVTALLTQPHQLKVILVSHGNYLQHRYVHVGQVDLRYSWRLTWPSRISIIFISSKVIIKRSSCAKFYVDWPSRFRDTIDQSFVSRYGFRGKNEENNRVSWGLWFSNNHKFTIYNLPLAVLVILVKGMHFAW